MEGDAEIEGSFLHRWLAGYFFLGFRYSRVFITMNKCRCVTQ